MDVDLVKSATEDQMEMMMMLMQMDKLPAEFLGPHMESITEMPSVHYASNGTGLNINMNSTSSIFSNFENPNPDSPTLVNHLSSASFMGNAVQEPMLSNSSSMRHMAGELSSGGNSSISKRNSMAAMREMIFRIAAMQPIHIDPESVKPPKRRNVKISKDPQSVAARHRRERISERIRILQRLVPGGTKMDTASMLDEAIHYVKFLKTQVQSLEQVAVNSPMGLTLGALSNGGNHRASAASMAKGYHHHHQLPAGGHQGFNSNSSHHQMLN